MQEPPGDMFVSLGLTKIDVENPLVGDCFPQPRHISAVISPFVTLEQEEHSCAVPELFPDEGFEGVGKTRFIGLV